MNKIINRYLDFEFLNIKHQKSSFSDKVEFWLDVDNRYVFQKCWPGNSERIYISARYFDRIQNMFGISSLKTISIIDKWIRDNLNIEYICIVKGCP